MAAGACVPCPHLERLVLTLIAPSSQVIIDVAELASEAKRITEENKAKKAGAAAALESEHDTMQ